MTLAELALHRGQIEGEILARVARLRKSGSTWSNIASQLGVTTQEAHRRYSWVDKVAKTGNVEKPAEIPAKP